ncbi:beta-ketoacyl-ACP synthase [Nonlabens spongiae]|uniref:3-oxoacyl-[acyl-carrier-protein] synthase 1 n=1 Tax=Nonlabens spongiae TaxID=331648 RepID=A0A1W6MHT2_9FLAO|nr:beta-ketoacyl-[acyl-carrier-protein] synthase family protein [Nonlabens spongiae]ARN77130.1 beta-ketoacyl-ACP synthase [Nonlabens spongiae]
MQKNRVVVTGLGVVAPNAVGVSAFAKALQNQTSGIRFDPQLAELNFKCQVSGTPQLSEEVISKNFTNLQLRGLKASGLVYGVIAGKEAFQDAELEAGEEEDPDFGIIMGTGQSGGEKFREAIHYIDDKNVRRLGSTSVIQTMTSGISAWLSGELGAGNLVTSNSSACCTGTEAFILGYERIATGMAKKMLVGSTSDSGPYIWGGFDAMRVLSIRYNDQPEAASRPLSNDAAGFVPGSGAGAMILEDRDSAIARGATIYCEVLGGALNAGGHRGDGSMTAPNGKAVKRCIKSAIANAEIQPENIDAINGHLTATVKDAYEIKNWSEALNLKNSNFPKINTFKSTIGHCLAAAGSIELVGSILQLKEQMIYGNSNITELHPDLDGFVSRENIPENSEHLKINHLIKASFGFGDVNAVVVLSQFVQS